MSLEKTVENARGRWRDILIHFGVEARFLEDRHGPCPLCRDGEDRFRWDNTDGNGGYYCSACGPGSGMHMLMTLKGWHFGQAAKAVDEFLPQAKVEQAKAVRSEASKRDFMKRLYMESKPVTAGDPVHLYLTRRCGDVAGQLGDIRYHPALKHSVEGGEHPAMLAFMGWNPVTKKFSGIHRTYLTREGQKAAVDPVRMNYGDAGPVRLGVVQERMGIAEGLETSMCARALFGLPVWSGICAEGVKAWEPPEGVRQVVIFADNDENFVGLAAAYEKARVLHRKGFEVEVQIPPDVGTDWADVWAAQAQMQGVA